MKPKRHDPAVDVDAARAMFAAVDDAEANRRYRLVGPGDTTIDLVTPPRQYWAAYAGSAISSEITIHETEREALEAVATALGLDFEETNSEPDEPAGRGAMADLDLEELREAIDEHCSTSADDWQVNEVTIP